jgi:protein-glutamine gamma-glutamyltransferase
VARTVLLFVLPAILIAAGWLRLEEGPASGKSFFWMAVLALLPAFVQPRWGRLLAAVLVSVLAIRVAFGVPFTEARPFDDRHDFFGPVLGSLKAGVLRFWDVSVPFTPAQEPDMHSVVLIAMFVFCLGIALGLAARRPLAACVVLVAGAVWPATLVSGAGFERGTLVLAAALSMLAWGRERPPHSLRPAVLAGIALAAAALGAASSEAVAKGAFLSWKRWDPYDQPAKRVGVRYVWNAEYGGIKFPEKVTTVLRVKAGPRPLYWRATTLDLYEDDRWVEELRPVGSSARPRDLPLDALMPRAASNRKRWVTAEVTVEALLDRHLAGPSVPVAYDPLGAGSVNYDAGGVATVPDGLRRGMRYRVWAFAPRPTPVQLARSKPPRSLRNTVHSRYLEIAPGLALLPFGSDGRLRQLRNILENPWFGPDVQPYEPLFQRARELTAQADTPYGAAFTLEAWFRAQGGFTYEEQPPPSFGEPPLVAFVTRTKAGYCQHFAGAMTLMLRSLGIPARVAVGFTSGSYSQRRLEWTVTDHDAHAWVEVWFDGYGWIPFDPTPGRGRLSGPYSSASPTLDTRSLDLAFPTGLNQNLINDLRARARGTGSDPARDVPGDLPGPVAAVRDTGESLLKLLALLLAAAVVAIALAKLAVRRSRYLTRDPRRIAAACRAELIDFLADQGVRVPSSSTFAELGDAVNERMAVDPDAFVAAAGAARFAPPREARAAARRARRELRLLQRRMRRHLSIGARARGLVSVRSLGLTG